MSQNKSEKPCGIKIEMESSVLTMMSDLKKTAFASKRNLTIALVLALYAFSNWSLSITNRKVMRDISIYSFFSIKFAYF